MNAQSFFRLELLPDGFAELILDETGEKVNKLSGSMMEALDQQFSELAMDKSLKGLLIRSGKPSIFVAGADIHEIEMITDEAEAALKSAQGQSVLRKLEILPFPTVAAIGGACLGGGLELALACTGRVVSDGPKTRLALPETSLGIIPGFGGTWRLPRLIGLSASLPMILGGKALDGKKAYQAGLADALCPEEALPEKARELLGKLVSPEGKRKIMKRRSAVRGIASVADALPFLRPMIYAAARKATLRRTRGLYPAPLEALKVIRKNYGAPYGRAMKIESAGFSRMAVTAVSKNLIRVFFAGEALKKEYRPENVLEETASHGEIREMGVLGAGKMGGSIAWLSSSAGIPVRMKDVNWKAIGNGFAAVHEIYGGLVNSGRMSAREAGLGAMRVTGAVDYSGFRNADFILEAIVEDLGVKRKTLAELEGIVREDAIIATNTSSLSVASLAGALKHPERFVGFHFFNPVSRMPLVEVVPGPETARAVTLRAVEFARKLGKTPIVVKDCNGFLVNRVLMSYLNEALLLLEDGADFAAVDRALLAWGMPMGPFELLDEIGIKVSMKVAHILSESYPDRTVQGKLHNIIGGSERMAGKSSGEGFYLYRGKNRTQNPLVGSILAANGFPAGGKYPVEEAVERCILRMAGEAALCMQDALVEHPWQLDMAMVLGAGFPPFRGGILAWIDSEGIPEITARLKRMETLFGSRFKPAEILLSDNGGKGRFYL